MPHGQAPPPPSPPLLDLLLSVPPSTPQRRLAICGNRSLPLPQHHAAPEDLVSVISGRAAGPRDGVPRAPGQDRDGVGLRLGHRPPPPPRHEQRDHAVRATP